MKRVIVIQARMTSTRLPGKVLMDLSGQPMLGQQLRRLKRCRRADEIVVATTRNAIDDPLVELSRSEGVRWFRGDEHDVLGRFLGAARDSEAEVVVRVTSDCPLIDPEVVDRVIDELTGSPMTYDYVSNVVDRTYPRGLDTEAMFRDTLERLGRMGQSVPAREHVTYFLDTERPDLFSIGSVWDHEDHSDLRWTVDIPEDLELVRRIYAGLDLANQGHDYRTILDFVRRHPELLRINAHVGQKLA